LSKQKKIALFILTALLVSGILLYVAYRVNQVMDSPDFQDYWLAGDLLNSGESPYNEDAWIPRVIEMGWFSNYTFIYPLPNAMFFSLWARMPYRFSYLLWMYLNMALVIASVLLVLARWKEQSKAELFILPAIAGLIIFRPLLVSIRNGQIGGLLLFIFTVSMLFFNGRKWFIGGILFSLLLLKPNIGVPVFGFFGIYLLLTKKWRAIFGIGVGSLAFLGVGLLISPGWVWDFIEISQRKLDITFGYSPTVWGLSHQLCSQELSCTIPVGSVLAVMLVGFYIWLIIKYKPAAMDIGAVFLPLVLLISPYCWAYEQVMLVFSILWIMGYLSQRGPFIITSLTFIGFSILSLGLLFLSISLSHDVFSFMVPVACCICLLIVIARKYSGSRKQTVIL
jgi:hypothetical protein